MQHVGSSPTIPLDIIIYPQAKDKRTGEQVAVKKCFDAFRNKTDAQRTYREVTYLQKLRHENIVAIKSISLSSDGRDLYATFDLSESDLANAIKIKPARLGNPATQITLSLKHTRSSSLNRLPTGLFAIISANSLAFRPVRPISEALRAD